MADELNTEVADDDVSGGTDAQMVEVDGKQVPLTEAPNVLKQMEHDIRSNLDRKLAQERQATQSALAEDVEFYSTHDQTEWAMYEPKVNGGRGYIGNGTPKPATQPVQQPVAEAKQPVRENPFTESREAKELREIKERLNQRELNEAQAVFNEAKAKYPYADAESVDAVLKSFYITNGRHPDAATIRAEFKRSSDFVRSKLPKEAQTSTATPPAGTGGTTATPKAGGASPKPAATKAPSILDGDAFGSYIRGRLDGLP